MATILILDDRATNRNIYARLAAAIEDGVAAEVFADPADALEWLEHNRVDLVIPDYKMPGMDGLDTARGIRQRRPDQVMILYTAYIDEALEKAAADAGISLCIGKVDGLASLEREINRLCASLF